VTSVLAWTGRGRDLLGRVGLVILAVAALAGPLRAAWQAVATPWWVTMGLATLLLLGWFRPRLAPAALLALVPLLPVVPALNADVPAGIVHLVVVSLAVPVLVRRALSRVTPPPVSFVVGWAVFLVVAGVSLAVALSPDRFRSAELLGVWREVASQVPSYVFVAHATQDGRALPLLIALADGLLCALVVQTTVTRERRSQVLAAAAAGGFATAVFGFVQAATGVGLQSAWATFDPGITRINSTFVDPNALASYYALIGPVVLALALGADRWRRVAWGGAFAAIVLAMVMTAGRTGLLSLGLACALLVWLALRRGLDEVDPAVAVRRYARPAARRALVGSLAIVVLLVVAGTGLNVQHVQQTSYLHTWLYTFNLRQPADAIAKGRLAVWQTVLGMVREAPVFGIGLGNAVSEFERYRDQLGIASLPADARLSAHNTFLLVTSELGLLGLSAWLLMMATVIHGIRAPGNLTARDRRAWPTLGLAAGLGGYALTMLTGDRILLREDIVIATTCAALACVGSGPLPTWLRRACWTLVIVALASWPVRLASRAADAGTLPAPQGVHDEQVGIRGDRYRWSTGYAVIFVPASSRSITLPVRNLSPSTQRVRVYVDGRLAEERTLEPGPWTSLTYGLAHLSRQGRWRRVAIEVEPTWQAPGDARVLGVVLGEWIVEPASPRP
jgi:O-antigen ligase